MKTMRSKYIKRFYRFRPSTFNFIMYPNSSNTVEQYMLSKFLNEAFTVKNNLYVTVFNI